MSVNPRRDDQAASDFAARWLRFNPERPTRPRLLKRFVVTLVGLLAVCAIAMVLTAR
jgi:hypothetical protein